MGKTQKCGRAWPSPGITNMTEESSSLNMLPTGCKPYLHGDHVKDTCGVSLSPAHEMPQEVCKRVKTEVRLQVRIS